MKISKLKTPQKDIKFVKDFNKKGKKLFVFGFNELAESIMKNYKLTGIIDEYTSKNDYNGVKVYKLSKVPKDALVVSVIIGRPLLAEKKLKKAGLKFLNYFSFSKQSSKKLKEARHWKNFKRDFKLNREKYLRIYNLLNDNESKQQFKKIINFRLSSNLKFMRGFCENQKNQYFENFLQLKSQETFIDVGCFDGHTSKMFIKNTKGKFNAIHIFEPDNMNMVSCKQNLKEYKNIHYYSFGLSRKKQKLYFSNQGSRSKAVKKGKNIINVDRLDNFDLENCTFIKMDIEGGERDAILGMKNTIIKFHPKIAVSVYHKYNDFIEIPKLILGINKNYKIFLRHYTEGVDETVMFFIPK
tara:strand:+ start:725 stop:1789 length:1065 start_codon:yes stop_codon:yes gene_type:complete